MTQIVYVVSPESQQIHVWKLNEQDGILKLIQVVVTPGQAQPIAVHPNKQFLYVGVRPDFKIITYSIDQSGLLINIGSIKICSSPTYLISNAQGTFLYCASYHYNTVSVFPIHTSGLVERPMQIIKDLLGCHCVGIDKHKKLLWIPCLKDNFIRLFKINTSGILIRSHSNCIIKSSNIAVGPRHITFHDTDCYAYVINELNSTIDVINYNCFQEKPNIIQTIDILPAHVMYVTQYWGADIHIAPNGRWLYCSDRAASIISIFKISYNTKQLKFIDYQLTEMQPRGFSIDSTGKFLVVAGQKSHYISLYHININNGKLTILSRHYSGKGPMWISIVTLD